MTDNSVNSLDLPSFNGIYSNRISTFRDPSPSVMLKNDENFIHKNRRTSIPDATNDNTNIPNFLQRFILSLPIFHPFGTFKRCWNLMLLPMLLYISIEIPITWVANADIWSTVSFYSVAALMIDTFLFIDVLITFRTARFFKYDHLKLEDNAFKIAKRYIMGAFLLDLITAFPFQLILYKQLVLLTCLRTLKLFRLYNMMKESTSNRSITSTGKTFRSFVRVFKLVCALLLIIHYTACIWWLEGENQSPSWLDAEQARNVSIFEKYSYSLYFVVTIKFIKATNVFEQWITIIHTLIGTATLSYFIGTLSSMISKGDRTKTQKEIRMSEAQAFCDQNKLPTRMKRAILAHMKYHCAHNYIFDQNKIFENIPTYLYKMVTKQLAEHIIDKITFFKPLKSHVRGLIAIKLKAISCNAGHKLFKKGDKCNKIYIQRAGVSVLKFHNDLKRRMYKHRGDVIGEYGLAAHLSEDFNGHTQVISTLEAKTWSEFYVIKIEDIICILKDEFGKNWKTKLKHITNIISYTPRCKVSGIDMDLDTNTALSGFNPLSQAQKSLKSLFQFNEFESIIKPQMPNAQTSDNISPLDGGTHSNMTVKIEAQKSRSIVIQLADLKSTNSYRSVSLGEDESDVSDIEIVMEETKESELKKETDQSGKGNNVQIIPLKNDKVKNVKPAQIETKTGLKKRKSQSVLKTSVNKKRKNGTVLKKHKNGIEKKEEFIDRATTLSSIAMQPMPKQQSNSYFKPRSMSFSLSDDHQRKKPKQKQKRDRNRSFKTRRSYFKKTKSEIRDRHLSMQFDSGDSVVSLDIPKIPERDTLYALDENMD